MNCLFWFYFVWFVFILIVLKFYKVNLAGRFAMIKVVMHFSVLLVAQMINLSKFFNQYCKDLDQLYDQKNTACFIKNVLVFHSLNTFYNVYVIIKLCRFRETKAILNNFWTGRYMSQLKKFTEVPLGEEVGGGVWMQKRKGQPTVGSRSYPQLGSRSKFLMNLYWKWNLNSSVFWGLSFQFFS